MTSHQPSELGRVTIRTAASTDAQWDTVVLFEESDCVVHLPELERQIRFTQAGACPQTTQLDSRVSVELCGRTLLVAVGSEVEHPTLLNYLRTSFPPAKDVQGTPRGAYFRIDWEGQRILIMRDSLRLGPIPKELIAAVAQEVRSAVADYLENGLPEITSSGEVKMKFPAVAPHSWRSTEG